MNVITLADDAVTVTFSTVKYEGNAFSVLTMELLLLLFFNVLGGK